MSKCPKCENIISTVNIGTVVMQIGRQKWKGVVYSCPFCFSAISAEMDPVALKYDIVNEVTANVKQLLKNLH